MTSSPSSVPRSSRASLFASRDFQLLLAGQTTSQLGAQVSGVDLPLLAVVSLHASPLEVGMLGAASALAFAAIGLPSRSAPTASWAASTPPCR